MASKHDLTAWDHAYLWHPFTQMKDWLAEEPLIVERGAGNYLIDIDGRRYLDGVSSLWCNVHGHRRAELDAALRNQIDRVAHSTMLGLANVPSIECAKELVAVAPPGLSRVFYSDAGATAVEVALRMAIQYPQLRGERRRTRFVSLTEAYHGDTIGAVSVGYSDAFHHYVRPLLFEAIKIDPPHVFRWQRGLGSDDALGAALAQAEQVFRTHGAETAALIIEPMMQGAAGMWNHPPAYLRGVYELAKQAGALVICDEVATGFGRTGRMFAVEHAGIRPDLLCLGKGISGGYMPLAATLASEEIFAAFLGPHEDFRALFHGHTYTGNPLACAVATANLRLFATERVVERVQQGEALLGELLERHVAPLAHVGDVRRVGYMTGIELVRDEKTRAPYPTQDRVATKVCLELRRHGIILRPLGPVVILMPPLSITEEELDHLVTATARSIDAVTGG